MEVIGLLHLPGRFTPEKDVHPTSNERLGGLQCRSGDFGEEKNLFLVPSGSVGGGGVFGRIRNYLLLKTALLG